MRTKLITMLIVTTVFGVATLARAAGEAGHGIRGWGPRVGFAADPDQLVIGAHMDAGRLAPRVRFQPDAELGVGDNVVILSFTAPVHYLFKVSGDIHPYAGGGLTLGFVSVDNGGDDVEAAVDLIGGLEWSMKSGNLFFTEFDIMVGDLQDFQVIAGWTFR